MNRSIFLPPQSEVPTGARTALSARIVVRLGRNSRTRLSALLPNIANSQLVEVPAGLPAGVVRVHLRGDILVADVRFLDLSPPANHRHTCVKSRSGGFGIASRRADRT